MPISAAVGRRIRELRLAAGLSPQGLAKRSGLRAAELLGIEEGRARPSLATLNELARQLKVPAAQLVLEAGRTRAPEKTHESLGKRLDRIGRAILDLPEEGSKLDAAEAAVVKHAMAICGGNKSAAARLIGVDRKALERRWSRIQRESARR